MNAPRPNANVSMNPNNSLLMKDRMRLSDNLRNPIPRSFYKTRNVSKYRNSVTRASQLSALSFSGDFSFSRRDKSAHSWR